MQFMFVMVKINVYENPKCVYYDKERVNKYYLAGKNYNSNRKYSYDSINFLTPKTRLETK